MDASTLLKVGENQEDPDKESQGNNNEEEEDDDDVQQIDPDDEDDIDEHQSKVKYIEILDWRNTNNAFTAFFSRKLRPNDYQIIISQVLGTGLLALGAWIICKEKSSYVGITVFVPFVHYGIASFSQIRTLSTDAPMNCFEYFTFFLAYAV